MYASGLKTEKSSSVARLWDSALKHPGQVRENGFLPSLTSQLSSFCLWLWIKQVMQIYDLIYLNAYLLKPEGVRPSFLV